MRLPKQMDERVAVMDGLAEDVFPETADRPAVASRAVLADT